ncbi:MAG: DUF3795 domain-containing protein, partial [bacterium]|nr:DUF3795 domain-containing protein [bacterium]
LCPRYQSTAKSRSPGCKVLSLTISCKLYNCCVKKKGLTTCAECGDFPCDKYEGFFEWDSFVSHAVCRPNLERIREVGLGKWLQEQTQKRALLESVLANYNDGRSRGFYCIATALMPLDLMKEAVSGAEAAISESRSDPSDIKAKAKILRSVIEDLASGSGISLKLRKKPK